MQNYLAVLVLTAGVEMLVVVGLGLLRRSRRQTPLGLVCLFLNLTTHPLATLVRIGLSVPLFPIEGMVVVFEAIGYRVVGRQSIVWSIVLSFVANLTSWGVGALFIASQST